MKLQVNFFLLNNFTYWSQIYELHKKEQSSEIKDVWNNYLNIFLEWQLQRFGNRYILKKSKAVVRKLFCKKGVLKNCVKITGKHLRRSLFFNEVARPATLLKERLWHRCFSVNIEHLSWRTSANDRF